MSLANAVAIGSCAKSIVLIGDQNQLPMVTQGVHPGGAAASSLEHLVGDATTIPRDRGLFLETSRRMHPAVNAFISPGVLRRPARHVPGHRAPASRRRRPRPVRRRDPLAADGPHRQRGTLARGGRGRRGGCRRPARDDLAGQGRAAQADHRRRRHRRRAIQRPGRRDPGGPAADDRPTRQRRDRRQVPGARGGRGDLLDGELQPRGRAARHGVPLLAATGSTSRSRERRASLSSSRPRPSSKRAAGRRSRCRWSTPCAASSRSPPIRQCRSRSPDR